MSDRLLAPDWTGPSLPIWTVAPDGLAARLDSLGSAIATFARANGFEASAGSHLMVMEPAGGIAGVLFGLGKPGDAARHPFLPGKLASVLPEGDWRFDGPLDDAALAALGWALEAYRFRRYRKPTGKTARLVVPQGVDYASVQRTADAVTLTRDLVNTAPNDLGPVELAAAIRAALEPRGATVTEIIGDDLLAQNLPLIHAVGHGSDRTPRLVDATWGDAAHPKVTLVGKGVCFDTGGLDIKPDTGMLLMKKDMGGAANVLGLATMIIDAKLPVRLRVLIPAVENAISGRAFRPSDVFPSRKGLTVEIGNTDAEGRLVLADALALADEEKPDLIVDMATLTGAARVALGPELPPFYTRDDALAADLQATAMALADPVWRMPLWKPYMGLLDSKIADTNNVTSGGFAGSVTAALFLSKFVENCPSWVHLDIYAWNPSAKPGRPDGGEAQAIRALYALIEKRYAAA